MHAHPFGSSIPALLAMLLVALATTAQAQWKWKDANGQVHVSNMPPPREVPDKNILTRPGAPSSAAKAAAAPITAASAVPTAAQPGIAAPKADSELEKRRKLAEAEEQNKKKAEEAKLAGQKAENCGRARAQLATLESGIRIAQTNAKGEREFLDDKARQGEVQRVRDVMANDCR